MPILAQETDIYPDDLLSPDGLAEGGQAQWWAVYTRSRQEKQLMRSLIASEIPCYCPIIPNRFRSPAGRFRTSYLPLFTNYVFMFADGYSRYQALKTNLIIKTIEVTDSFELTQDLRQIQRIIKSGLPLSVETRLQPGCKVRIKSGPLSHVEGVVLKRSGADFLFVSVNFLQQGALVKLEDYEVEPLFN